MTLEEAGHSPSRMPFSSELENGHAGSASVPSTKTTASGRPQPAIEVESSFVTLLTIGHDLGTTTGEDYRGLRIALKSSPMACGFISIALVTPNTEMTCTRREFHFIQKTSSVRMAAFAETPLPGWRNW